MCGVRDAHGPVRCFAAGEQREERRGSELDPERPEEPLPPARQHDRPSSYFKPHSPPPIPRLEPLGYAAQLWDSPSAGKRARSLRTDSVPAAYPTRLAPSPSRYSPSRDTSVPPASHLNLLSFGPCGRGNLPCNRVNGPTRLIIAGAGGLGDWAPGTQTLTSNPPGLVLR